MFVRFVNTALYVEPFGAELSLKLVLEGTRVGEKISETFFIV